MSIRATVLFLALSLGIINQSEAAFVIKKEVPTELTTNAAPPAVSVTNENNSVAEEAGSVTTTTAAAHLVPTFGKARISKFAYIFLSVIGFGFISIGLNDHFSGSSWIVCLVLGLLYVPGLIYALVSMPRYYHNHNKVFKY